jgi:short-subunit dehydrogenase
MIIEGSVENGKAVLISGTSTGIGHVTALLLDRQGYRVFAGVRTKSDAEALRAIASPRLQPVILDVTKPAEVEQALATIDLSKTPLFAVINNAGFNLTAAFEFTDETKARELIETNLFGLARLSQACLPLLRRTAAATGESTKIINLGSIGSLVGIPWEAWYHASKFAVLGLSESLRSEVHRHGVRVSVICPGGIKTPFVSKSRDGAKKAAAALPTEGRALYGRGIAALGDLTAQVDRFGSTPEKVARAILKTLERRDPPFRVLVGADARMMNVARAILPTTAFHALLRQTFAC